MRFDREGDVNFQLDLLFNEGLDLFDNFRLPVELGIETEFNQVNYGWPSINAIGTLTNDGKGNLTWSDAAPDVTSLGTLTSVVVSGLSSLTSIAGAIVSKTGTYTATPSDHTILCGAGNETFTVTLPLATGVSGIIYNIKNLGTGTITVDGDGGETIDGSITAVISTQYASITLHCDGSNWHII